METTELIKKVRKIEIKTKGLSNHIFSGQYHSAFKGKGMAFSEVREYMIGDDIRSIDWNVTARYNHPYIKVFEEERELTVMLLIDVSNSNVFGSKNLLKSDLITELAAVLSFSAISNNDKVGVIFFSNKIEKFIPPKKGKTHILRIIRELINFTPENTGTNISEALKYFTNVIKKKCTAFLISDFIDKDFFNPLQIANKKHEVIALKISDTREYELPDVGIIRLKDAETNELLVVDSSNKEFRDQYKKKWVMRDAHINETLMKSGVDFATIRTDIDYIKPLIGLFKKRSYK